MLYINLYLNSQLLFQSFFFLHTFDFSLRSGFLGTCFGHLESNAASSPYILLQDCFFSPMT